MAVSRLERKLVKLGKEEAATREARASGGAAGAAAAAAARYGKPAVLLVLAALYWGTAIAAVPVGTLGPAAMFLSFPGWPRGTVGVVAWLAAVNAVAGRAVVGAARVLGVGPPPDKGAIARMMDSITSALKG